MTHTSLLESIDHWRQIANAGSPEEVEISEEACALCREFAGNWQCSGCPVAEAGFWGCRNPEFMPAFRALEKWLRGTGSSTAFREAALAELRFLESLVPEGPTGQGS